MALRWDSRIDHICSVRKEEAGNPQQTMPSKKQKIMLEVQVVGRSVNLTPVLGVTWDTVLSSWTGTSSFHCAMYVLYVELIQRHDELF